MEGFLLKIATPDGTAFDGEVRSVLVRTTCGDVGILKNHADYVGTIDYGMVKITDLQGKARGAACMNGFVSVDDGLVRIVATTFEFADSIDLVRAQKAKEKAEQRIAAKQSRQSVALAEMKLRRAINRIHIYESFH